LAGVADRTSELHFHGRRIGREATVSKGLLKASSKEWDGASVRHSQSSSTTVRRL